MSSEQGFLALYFQAPLLSFGVDSKLDRRDTLGFPTRGVVTGLVAAALGIDRGNVEGLKSLRQLQMLSIVFPCGEEQILTDYHTVGGGWQDASGIPRTAENERKTAQTYRQYLANGRFAAVLSGEIALLNRVAEALQNPVWGGWIGRKSCIPTVPIYQGLFVSEEEALQHLRSLVPEKSMMRIFEEYLPGTPDAQQYYDMPENFETREFSLRAVMER